MSDINPVLIVGALIVSYFLGTIPSALIVSKRGGIDVTAAGSGNPGTSNVVRLLGWKYGLVVFVADVLKGSLAVGIGGWVAGERVSFFAYACGYAAVIGHTFPVTRKFHGGKGVATGGGAMYVLYPWMSLVLCTSWFVLRKVTGKSAVASLVITIAVPIYVVFIRRVLWEDFAALGLVVLIVIRHIPNIKRLSNKEENAA